MYCWGFGNEMYVRTPHNEHVKLARAAVSTSAQTIAGSHSGT